MGLIIVVATYAVIAAFYVRLGVHALTWWEAVRRSPVAPPGSLVSVAMLAAGATADVFLLRRLFMVNPALWIGEWVFHGSLLLIVFRHLRYFMNPVPVWVAWAQTPGWIAGFLLPLALLAIFAIRLLAGREKFSSPVNLLMLLNVLAIGVTGLLMSIGYRVDLVRVKLYTMGIVTFHPAAPPLDALFVVHVLLVLALILYVPSHVFTAPLVLLDARRRDFELRWVLHDE